MRIEIVEISSVSGAYLETEEEREREREERKATETASAAVDEE